MECYGEVGGTGCVQPDRPCAVELRCAGPGREGAERDGVMPPRRPVDKDAGVPVRSGSVGAPDAVCRPVGTRAAEMVERQIQRGRAAAADQETDGENQRFYPAEG